MRHSRLCCESSTLSITLLHHNESSLTIAGQSLVSPPHGAALSSVDGTRQLPSGSSADSVSSATTPLYLASGTRCPTASTSHATHCEPRASPHPSPLNEFSRGGHLLTQPGRPSHTQRADSSPAWGILVRNCVSGWWALLRTVACMCLDPTDLLFGSCKRGMLARVTPCFRCHTSASEATQGWPRHRRCRAAFPCLSPCVVSARPARRRHVGRM